MNKTEYCEWAITGIRNYYNALLLIEKENPWTNLRLNGGQIQWILDEEMMWMKLKEEYQ